MLLMMFCFLWRENKAILHLGFKARSGNIQTVGNMIFCAEPKACICEDVFEAVQRVHLGKRIQISSNRGFCHALEVYNHIVEETIFCVGGEYTNDNSRNTSGSSCK